MNQHHVAPADDIKSRGIPHRTIIGIVAVLTLAFYVGRLQGDDGDDGEAAVTAFWPLGLLIWGVVRLVQLLLGIAVLFLVFLVCRQRVIIYMPTPPGTQRSPQENPNMYRSPDKWHMPYENVMVPTSDGTKIHSWLIYQKASTSKSGAPYTIIYFHGNAGNIGHRLENLHDMFDTLKVNILAVDYRGYGDSEDGGGPSEPGFMKDAIGSYEWLVERAKAPPTPDGPQIDADRILIFGRSIGGAVGICLAAHVLEQRLIGAAKPMPLPAGVIIENTFTSLGEMAVQVFPFLSIVWPILRWPVLLDEWKCAERMAYLAANHHEWCCCLLSGLKDEIVPCAQMQQHYANLHNDTPHRGGAAYWRALSKFMVRVEETEGERRRGIEAQCQD